ncbi:unnamed protein product [Pleuronectes platessa]|uniref:Uncharacterized protein n=1 Tax=Pleuronectes platessa TaxID=8262 RepID=A0A9N7VEI5_PLEPL|nr:unnamed protein product [Pleuronectes platessa]
MRVSIPKDNPNMTCQAVPLQSQSMVSNQQDHDPPIQTRTPLQSSVTVHRHPPRAAPESLCFITGPGSAGDKAKGFRGKGYRDGEEEGEPGKEKLRQEMLLVEKLGSN